MFIRVLKSFQFKPSIRVPWRPFAVFILAATTALGQAGSAGDSKSTIHFKNGDWLRGALAAYDPAVGGAACSARGPGREARCLVQWDGTASVFTDSCAPEVTWPPDGDGLDQMAWQVVEGELRVDVGGTRPADWEAGP